MNSSRLVSRSLWVAVIRQVREGQLARPQCPEGRGGSPDDGVHAPHLRRALEDTKRPGQGVALVRRGQSSSEDTNRLGTQGGHFPQSPTLPLQAGGRGAVVVRTAVCRVGAILPVVDLEEGPYSRMPSPITARQRLKGTVEGRAADR